MRETFVDVQISVILHGLLGTPGNLELRNLDIRGMTRLAFIVVSLAGLMGDVDAGHSWRSL